MFPWRHLGYPMKSYVLTCCLLLFTSLSNYAAKASAAKVPAAPTAAPAAKPAPPAAPAARTITLYLIGDSTMANKQVIPAGAERGWGQMLSAYFRDRVRVDNRALDGRSSKSFYDEGRWADILKHLAPGDWVIIQFGHNDEKKADPTRFTEPFGEFQRNLTRYVRDTQARGAHPILATPVVRRAFDAQGQLQESHGDYPRAMRELARELNVPLLDLNARSAELVQALGDERSRRLYMWVEKGEFPGVAEDKQDNTHFNAFGASRMCDLAVTEIIQAAPELAKHLHMKDPAPAAEAPVPETKAPPALPVIPEAPKNGSGKAGKKKGS